VAVHIKARLNEFILWSEIFWLNQYFDYQLWIASSFSWRTNDKFRGWL